MTASRTCTGRIGHCRKFECLHQKASRSSNMEKEHLYSMLIFSLQLDIAGRQEMGSQALDRIIK